MTAQQKRILKFIRHHGPTIPRAIANRLGLVFVTPVVNDLEILELNDRISWCLNCLGEGVRLVERKVA